MPAPPGGPTKVPLELWKKSQSARDKSGEYGGIGDYFNALVWSLDRQLRPWMELEVPVPGLAIPGATLAWLGRQTQVIQFK